MQYNDRFAALNDKQRQAVETIDGPVMIIAGPGTGKTELLSMRVATILQKTDTLPENILCLTYTDSGVTAMRRRLSDIIGPAAYKVAIHTFHSFSTEVINHNREFFYNGAQFRPADELNSYETLKSILDDLEPGNILASRMNGAYTYLKDILTVIAELKRSGLTSAELLTVLDSNDTAIQEAEEYLVPILAPGIKKNTAAQLAPFPDLIAQQSSTLDVPGVSSFADVLSGSLRVAVEAAETSGTTKPITAWKDTWFTKNDKKEFILKTRKRQQKLRAVAAIYDQFIARMQEAGLFDFDDMILNTVHALEVIPELRYNLQEKYLYIMVDEFQDTNLAQMRILLSLIQNDVNEGSPNLMVVGDDDQAIYGFQGATVGNIHGFIEQFPGAPRIVLTDNYRSTDVILKQSRRVITLGKDRLEYLLPGLDKSLTAHRSSTETTARLTEYASTANERHAVAQDVAQLIKNGHAPGSIAVLARRHHELVDLLPYFADAAIPVNYERHDNVLAIESIQLLEYIATLLVALQEGRNDIACGMIPELLAHPAFAIDPQTIWQLSMKAQHEHKNWLEVLPEIPALAPLFTWLIEQATASAHTPLEYMCDRIIGTPESLPEGSAFVSPLYSYYFAPDKLETQPDAYLTHLGGLIAIRTRLREYYPGKERPTLRTFLDFLHLQRESGGTITSIQPISKQLHDSVTLMTAHKSKGLEFDTVYIVGAVDNAWGEKARSRVRHISYPENLPLQPAGDSIDDRLRLFYVAMTRARRQLFISYSTTGDTGKEQLPASFLTGEGWNKEIATIADTKHAVEEATIHSWYQPIIRPLSAPMKELLMPRLEHYKLNATHLNNFLDLTRGGPEGFLVNNLLKFPQAPSGMAAYGNAVHAALQRAHAHTTVTGELRPHEDILKDFETALDEQYLPIKDFEHFLQRGSQALTAYLRSEQAHFTPTQKTELNFGGQGVSIGEARLTGILDVIEPEGTTVTITDYKTGKGAYNWTGRGDYEKMKLHRYRTQLLFYDLLVSESRHFSAYTTKHCRIQFIDPTTSGDILRLDVTFTDEERARLKKLIQAVWQHITTLSLPDTSNFEPTYKGALAFEDALIDEVL